MIDIGKDLQRAYDDGYAQGKQDAVKWIPVTERLPYAYKKVLTYERIRGVQVNFCGDDGDWWIGSKITHWMPLPEPPKAGETETTYHPPINWCGEEPIGDY